MAAVSLATPVFLIFMSLGTLFGVGGTSVISRSLGEGKKEYAGKVFSFCMWGCVLTGIIMSALMLIFMDKILLLAGASSDTCEYTETYLTIVVMSGPFVLISNCYSNVIRAAGQSVRAMMGQLLGNLLNVLLDPIMILLLGWNVAGAAVATVIGNVFGAYYYLHFFISGKSTLSIRPRDFTVKEKVLSGVLSIGIPAALGSVLMSISQIIVNSRMSSYSDMSVAAMTVLCYVFTRQLVGAFLTDETAFSLAVSFARILLSTGFLFGVFYVLINALQAMGAATESLIISLSRQGIIFIPALFVLEATAGMSGIVWAQPVADVLSLALAAMIYFRIWRKPFNLTT